MNFRTAEKMFRDDQIRALSDDAAGLRYLKLRSVSRKAHLTQLFATADISPKSTLARDMLKEAFATGSLTDQVIQKAIRSIYEPERQARAAAESDLISQLYKLEVFDWGGLHQNSLESTIVNNYIKKIRSFDRLNSSIDNELHNSMRGYVLCSWYNHWTSIIIEDIFRDHVKVLPAVGLIKKIDFFLNDVPFDLKVTYLPEGYVKERRSSAGESPEITLLKRWARTCNVPFDNNAAASRLLADLWRKASDHPSSTAQDIIGSLYSFRQKVVEDIKADSLDLIRWLYENQGVRRFDASNRLFLVLIDPNNFFESWKLKRARPLLAESIDRYLDNADSDPGRSVQFAWQDATHRALSDAIIVTKPQPQVGNQRHVSCASEVL